MYTAFIVDDEKYGIYDLQETMEWEKYNVTVKQTFQNPRNALECILSYIPDIVFTDIKMPVMDGITLIKKCREKNYKGEFVIVSSYNDFEYAREAIHYEVSDYCLKPLDESDANQVLSRIKKKLDQKAAGEGNGGLQVTNTVLADILDYVEINLHTKLSINTICERFHISSSYCCKLFKYYLNTSFVSYLLEKRMEYAKRLLKSTEMPINEIAYKCGFDDYFYFAKKFKGMAEVTPSEYRNNERLANVCK